MTHKEKIKLINPIFRDILGKMGYLEGLIENTVYDYEHDDFDRDDLSVLLVTVRAIMNEIQVMCEENSE